MCNYIYDFYNLLCEYLEEDNIKCKREYMWAK